MMMNKISASFIFLRFLVLSIKLKHYHSGYG
jgi:hypothetical protein